MNMGKQRIRVEFVRLISFLSLFFIGCENGTGEMKQAYAPDVPAYSFTAENGSNALARAGELVSRFTPRDAGTKGAEEAAAWICGQLQAVGVDAKVDSFSDKTPRGETRFHNVLGTIPGTGDEWIVLLSHFDTMSGVGKGFEGANDGASSTGLLLELARVLRAAGPHQVHLLFGFMDGEECMVTYCDYDGFHGSKRLAAQMKRDGKKVRAVLLADMVGDRDLKITVPRNASPALRVLALEAAEKVGVRDSIGLFDGIVYDDHQAFLDVGFPAVNLIDFSFGSAPGKNDYWHTPQDTMDKLSAESLFVTGRILCEMIRQLESRQTKER